MYETSECHVLEIKSNQLKECDAYTCLVPKKHGTEKVELEHKLVGLCSNIASKGKGFSAFLGDCDSTLNSSQEHFAHDSRDGGLVEHHVSVKNVMISAKGRPQDRNMELSSASNVHGECVEGSGLNSHPQETAVSSRSMCYLKMHSPLLHSSNMEPVCEQKVAGHAEEQKTPLIFIEKLKSTCVNEGECTKFTCRVKGQPVSVVRWEKDGQQISGEKYKVTNVANTFTLEITQTVMEDAGRYVCTAMNETGEIRSMASLIVQKTQGSKVAPTDVQSIFQNRTKIVQLATKSTSSPDYRSVLKKRSILKTKPTAICQQLDYSAIEGDTVSMSCKISGFPEPNISWFFVTELIKGTDSVKITCLDGISSIKMTAVKTSDCGLYICRVENDLGCAEASCSLTVKSKQCHQSSTESAITPAAMCSDVRDNTGNCAPVMLSRKPVEEDSLSLASVPENCSRIQKLSQFDTNDLLKNLPQNELSQVEFKCTNATKNDNHINDDGDNDDAFENPSSAAIYLPEEEQPLIEDLQPENIHILRGSEIRLAAKFTGHPLPEANWFRGNELLEQDGRTTIETKPGCAVLVILNAKPQDTGIYTLTLNNKFGQDKQYSSVTIEDRPEPPVGVPAMTSILSNSLVLSWSGSSYDGGCPIVKYKIEILQHDGNWKVLTEDCEHTTYQVENLTQNTEYRFRVSAANKHGFSDPGQPSDIIITNGIKLSWAMDDFPFLPRNVTIQKDQKFSDFYILGNEIGKGKFGSVYKCIEKSSNRHLAAKFIRVKSGCREDILMEIALMNDLHHPKLVLLWDAFESRRDIVLVTEHVSGGELLERIINDDYELTERECIHFMRQICEGVRYMHLCNVLHLDLKPENILCVTPNSNEVKIIDFGLARKFDPKTELKVMFGTAEFVAPEVLNYDPVSYTTDMWSVGVIAYILLSGLSPFLGNNDKETFCNVAKAQYDFDDESFNDITSSGTDFISKLLLKDVKKRMMAEESLQHRWLAQDVTYMRAKKLSTVGHKKFMARRKWQKMGHALMALRRMGALQRFSSGSFEGGRRSPLSSSSQADTQSVTSDTAETLTGSDDSGITCAQVSGLDSNNKLTFCEELNQMTSDVHDANHSQESSKSSSGFSEISELSGYINNSEMIETMNSSVKENSPENQQSMTAERPAVDRSTEITELQNSDGHKTVTASKSESISADVHHLSCSSNSPEIVRVIETDKPVDQVKSVAELADSSFDKQSNLHIPVCKTKTEMPAKKGVECQAVFISSDAKKLESCKIKSFGQKTEIGPDAKSLELSLRKTSGRNSELFSSKSIDKPSCLAVNIKSTNSADQQGSPRSSKLSRITNKSLDKPISSAMSSNGTGVMVCERKASGQSVQSFGLSRNSTESSIAARKLAVQQSSTQRNSKPKKAPMFVRKMKDLAIVEGTVAKFEVFVDGNPLPDISWFKDGKEIIMSSEKYKTESNNDGKWTLMIMDCGEDDDAEYGCKASSSSGSISTKANLYVEPIGEVLDNGSAANN